MWPFSRKPDSIHPSQIYRVSFNTVLGYGGVGEVSKSVTVAAISVDEAVKIATENYRIQAFDIVVAIA